MNSVKDQDFKIVLFEKSHAQKITGFQLKMAKQTQNLDLIPELVLKAIHYLYDHQELGFYLVKLHKQVPIGSLLLTFQNSQSWWIQSVYVQKDYRRQGHFKSLFYEACNIAKQRGSHSLKLYAQSQNQRAKQTYRSLGMNQNGEKFYTYDFVYGKAKLEQFIEKSEKTLLKVRQGQEIEANLQQFKSLMNKQTKQKNKHVLLYKGSQKIGMAFYFTQFSQWRFGLAYYIENILISEQCFSEEINQLHSALCAYFCQKTQLKVGAIRYILTQKSQNLVQILKGGQFQHYDVMQIDF